MANFLQENAGLFVPTTNIWDVASLKDIDVTKPEFKELLIRLYQNINNITLALNLKDSAYYVQQEFVNGQAFFANPNTINFENNPRQVYRMVINCGSLPDTATINIAHNINPMSSYTFTRVYGCSSDQTSLSYLPLPYSSSISIADNIELNVDSTYVNITTGSDRSSYVTTYVILEYLKE